jgi:hypothetical protein
MKEMEAIAEWQSFATLAVNTLGMPATGNSGHNRDSSYIRKTPYIIRKTISLAPHTRRPATHRHIPQTHDNCLGEYDKKGVGAVMRGK